MKKLIVLSIAVILAVILSAQEIQHEAIAINVEVPVRVFEAGVFIDNLTIDDFELYEEGVKQKIDAVYLIKKTTQTLVSMQKIHLVKPLFILR